MEGELTGVFRKPEEAAAALQQLRALGFEEGAVSSEERKGGLLEALLPNDDRSDETRLTVQAGDRVEQVRQILMRCGARQIEGDGLMTSTPRDGQTLPLAEEELQPRRSVVQVGEVVVRKVVITEMRTLEVPVRREEIVVERAVLNEPLAAPAGNRFAQQTTESDETETAALNADEEVIRIPILEEMVTVEKHPVVREEVRVLKRRIQDVVQVSETVRREEPVMERTTMPTDGGQAVPAEVLNESEDVRNQPRQYQ